MFYEYTKIPTIFKRDTNGSKKLIEGDFTSDEIAYLANLPWICTEKIDGTNIDIVWDGHKVSFQGRTERSDIPKNLLDRLEELFGGIKNEELFEQVFGNKYVIFYGEGYGHKIQKVGDLYNPENVDFILFDVYFPDSDLYLKRHNVEDVASIFNIDVVPIIGDGVDLNSAVEFIKRKPVSTLNNNCPMEGLVCKPYVELRDREGKRIITKIKVCDFDLNE